MSKSSVCILDYGSGNVKSVYNIFNFLGYNVTISNKKNIIKDCTHIVLPGVGAFESSMEKIKNLIPFDTLENQVIKNGKPFLGICLGMQVLATHGTEFKKCDGFGWIDGSVDLIKTDNQPVPHIGWNEVKNVNNNNLLVGLETINDFYFVHSYVFNPHKNSNIGGITTYENDFVSCVQKNNIYGVQFHPEKSQKAGQLLIKNFMNI